MAVRGVTGWGDTPVGSLVLEVGVRGGRDAAPAEVADGKRPARGDERGGDPQMHFLLVRGEEGATDRTDGQRRSVGRHRIRLRVIASYVAPESTVNR